MVLSEGFIPDSKQGFLGRDFRFLDRYELQGLLVEALAQTKHHRRKAAAVSDCHRMYRHWRCRNGHDWAEAENSCSVRVCPHCCARRSRILAARIDRFLLPRENSALRYVVLSERNSSNVAEGMKSLWASWFRLRRSVRWKRKVRGCIVALEVTYNSQEDTWHPHLNVIFEGDYFPHEELRQAWIEATEQRGEIVWISKVNAGTTREMIKYVTKISDLVSNAEALDRFLTAVHKKRFVRMYGSFFGLSMADEHNPVASHCPDCESQEYQLRSAAFDRNSWGLILTVCSGCGGEIPAKCERRKSRLHRSRWDFSPLRHKYAPRPGHERTPAWARRLDLAVREVARQQVSGN